MSVYSLLQTFENKCPKRYQQYCPEIKHIDLDVVLTWYIAISVASWWTDRHNRFKKYYVPSGFTQFVFSFTCVIRILYLLDCYYSVKMLIKVTLLLVTSVQSHFIIDLRTYGKIYAIKNLNLPENRICIFIVKRKMWYAKMLVIFYQPSFSIVPSNCWWRIGLNMALQIHIKLKGLAQALTRDFHLRLKFNCNKFVNL